MTPGSLEAGLVGLLDQQVFLPLALLAAVVLGAGHACAPGHGKTLAAAYLVGGRARSRDALLLGLAVAAMHTFSVAVLGVAWYVLAGAAPDMGALSRWLQLAGALVVLAVGLGLLRRHLLRVPRGRVAPPVPAVGVRQHGSNYHVTRRQHHQHDQQDEPDGHQHAQDHADVAGALLTRRGLLTLGAAGGLLPSPAAFLVLITGLFTGQALSAGLLVAAFGLGMAATLGGLGWAVLRGRDALLRHAASPQLQRWAVRLPLAAAATVVLGGLILTGIAAARLLTA